MYQSKAESRANQHICEPKSKRQYALHINVKSTEIKWNQTFRAYRIVRENLSPPNKEWQTTTTTTTKLKTDAHTSQFRKSYLLLWSKRLEYETTA